MSDERAHHVVGLARPRGRAAAGSRVGDANDSRVGEANDSRVGEANDSRVGEANHSRVDEATHPRRRQGDPFARRRVVGPSSARPRQPA